MISTRVCLSSEHIPNSPATEYERGENGRISNLDQAVTKRRKRELLCSVLEPADNTLSLEQTLDEVSRWLAALDCTEKQESMLKLRQEGTCTWFPKTDAYKKWRAGGNQFLWLHGQGMVSGTSRVITVDIVDRSTYA